MPFDPSARGRFLTLARRARRATAGWSFGLREAIFLAIGAIALAWIMISVLR